MRRLAACLLGIVLLLLLGFFALRDADLARELLVDRYGGPSSRFAALPSGALAHYRIQGRSDGPTLLLVHGSNASLHTWEPWVRELGADYRIVTVDLPGHGLTSAVPGDDYSDLGMARFLEELRAQLGIERWSVAGNSMGGAVAWRYALAHPERVEALVLVDSGGPRPPGTPDEPASLAFALAETPGLNRLLEHITPRSLVAEGLRSAFYDESRVDEVMIDRYYELMLHPGSRRAHRLRFSRPGAERSPELLRQIEAPTLILWGEEDRLIPVAVGQYLDELIPESELVVYPKVGHIPMEEAPQKSARTVREFLARQPFDPGSALRPEGVEAPAVELR